MLNEAERKVRRSLHKSLGAQPSTGSDSERQPYGSSTESIGGSGSKL